MSGPPGATDGERPRLLPIEAYSTQRPRRSVGVLLLGATAALALSLGMLWHVTYPPGEPPVYYYGYQIPERITLPLLLGGGTWLGIWTMLRPAGAGAKMLLGVLLFFWFGLAVSHLMSGYYENGVVVLREGFWLAGASFVAVVAACAVCWWPEP
ncbi:MAG TPA: hypothetical protein VKU39_09055 [Streptosporangiaceae bacterium]|nr:hypothetical protein [Streptosporangiaceae bacterium]